MSQTVPVYDIIIIISFLIEVGKNNKCNDFAAGCSKKRSHPAGQPQTWLFFVLALNHNVSKTWERTKKFVN